MSKVDNRQKEEELRHCYQELRAYLSAAPKISDTPGGSGSTREKALWVNYNNRVDETSKITGSDYSRFKVIPKTHPRPTNYVAGRTSSIQSIDIFVYRQQLTALISTLHSQYFSDDPDPLQEPPGMQFSQQVELTQIVNLQILLQSEIDSRIKEYKEGSKERKFLEKLRAALLTMTDIGQFVTTLLRLYRDF